MTGVLGSTPATRVTFGDADITDMIQVKTVPPWLHFPWGEWPDYRDHLPEAMRVQIDKHQSHDLMYRMAATATEFRCRTCEKATD